MIRNGKGELVVARRPAKDYKAADFAPCIFCYGFYLADTLWQHGKTCLLKPDTADTKNMLRSSRALLSPHLKTGEQTSEQLEKLFAGMSETKAHPGIRELCSKDVLIREFAKSQLGRLGSEDEQRRRDMANIRSKVRTLGRLLTQLNADTLVNKDLCNYLSGQYFDAVVEATKKLAKESDSPKLALTIGHYLKHTIALKISLGIKEKVVAWKKDAKDMQYLFDAHWTNNVSSVAQRRLSLRKLNKPVELPLQEDIMTLTKFIDSEVEKILGKRNPTRQELKWLAQLLIVRIVTFNKRRISEVDEITVTDFVDRVKHDSNNFLQYLDASEQALANRCVS